MPRMLADGFDNLINLPAGAGAASAGLVESSAAGVTTGAAPAEDAAAGTTVATFGAEAENVAAADDDAGKLMAVLGKDAPPNTGRLEAADEADDGGKAVGAAKGLDEKGEAEDEAPKEGTTPPATNPNGAEPKPNPEPEPPNCALLPKPTATPNTEE